MPFLYNYGPEANYFYTNSNQIATTGLLVYINSKDSTSYNGTGLTAFDLSGNNNNMSLSSITWDSVNKAFSFNGSSSYIYTPNIYSQLTTGNSVFSQTQEIWYKSSAINGILVDETNNLAQTGWHDSQIELVSGQVKSRYWNLNSPYVTLGTNDTSKWNYACIRYNGTTQQIDANFNGIFTSSTSFLRQFAPTPAVIYYVLGLADLTNMGGGTTYYNGLISIYRTYKRALTNSEIISNYNSQKSLF